MKILGSHCGWFNKSEKQTSLVHTLSTKYKAANTAGVALRRVYSKMQSLSFLELEGNFVLNSKTRFYMSIAGPGDVGSITNN